MKLETIIGSARDSEIARVLGKALDGQDLTENDIGLLFSARERDLVLLCLVADHQREAAVGKLATYVVNRNINFTNICYNHCGFCAFSRPESSPDAYSMSIDEIVEEAREAERFGATEVCIQAGIAPDLAPDFYLEVCRRIRDNFPGLHIHAFSPQEIAEAASKAGGSIRTHVRELKAAGLGSVPGTSAEILDDEVRRRISPRRINTRTWMEVITAAHEEGLHSSATIVYGHIETPVQRARHLLLVRNLQRRTRGFTEFVPLRFVGSQIGRRRRNATAYLCPTASGEDVLRMHAVARLVLGKDLPNIQVSWVKEGPAVAGLCLRAGANDLGGTLMKEKITASAGGSHGEFLSPESLQGIIRKAGLVPAERTTLYRIRRTITD